MAQYDMTPEHVFTTPYSADAQVSAFVRSVYGWMFVGLGITAVVAFVVAASPAIVMAIASIPFGFIGLFLVQIGLVVWLSAQVQSLSPGTAGLLFMVYSALTGVTMSFVLLAYTGESVASTFVIASGMFGAMALYGTTTRRSLAGWGQFLFMGLIGVILASIAGMFFRSEGFQFLLGFVGVIVFTGLTAYDAQRLKQMALALPGGQTGSYAIVGALALYLDFINLFLMLLRLLGSRRS